MIFTQKTIAPAGRNKYGRYYAAGNITKSVVSTTYAGNNTTTTIQEPNKPEEEIDDKGFYCILSKASTTFDALSLVEGTTDSTMVVAYRGYDKAPVYVCDMDLVTTTESDGIITSITAPPNMGIQNIPSGITVTISNNGTTGSTITFYADSDLTGTTGTIRIPAVIYKRSEATPKPDDLLDWYNSKAFCEQVWLDFTWTVNRNGSSTYVMDLSNERAGVNCDSAGTIYTASTAALTCTASTYYGTEIVASATYTISIQPRYNAVGVSIAQATGVLQWANNFSFTGPTLPIDVIAWVDGTAVATKTMNIEKNYPGADGSPAVTRWIVTDYDVIKYNPNNGGLIPSKVQAWVMKQTGGDEPVRDTGTTIYYGYDTTTPTQPLPSAGATTYTYIDFITFALKTTAGVYYEVETVPVIAEGEDGTDGQDGASGESAWYLTLSNDNASINADADGNILSNAIRPSCKAKLYHGKTRVTSGISYSVDYGGASGVTSGVSSGILTLTFGSSFNFTGGTVSITISASTENTLRDMKVMNVTKSLAGENGEDAVSYWLEPSCQEILYNPNTHTCTPSTITCEAYKQVGEDAIVVSPSGETTIKYQWHYRTTNSWSSESIWTRGTELFITSGDCENYYRLRFKLYKGSSEVDREDIEFVRDGVNGVDGGQGRTGAAIRGPYDFDTYSASTRCWCAGASSSTCDECSQWIDVILKDGTYYYCNTTYYGKLTPWNTYKSYWTSGDTFDFIATNLLLANNASINFLTGNELYLRNSNNEITAGAAGGNGINFWAGSDSPGNAPFKVNYDGTLTATKGTFGAFTIGTDTLNKSSLNTSGTSQNEDDLLVTDKYSMSSEMITMTSTAGTHSTELYISATEHDIYRDLANANIDLKYHGGQNNDWRETKAIETNGTITGTRFIGKRGSAVTSFPRDIEVIFTTSSSTMFQKTGYWHINGYNTYIPYTAPGCLFHKVGTFWWYENENTRIPITPATGATDTFTTGSTGAETWTFNGSDLGINYAGSSAASFNTAHNAWLIAGVLAYNTGIQHPTSGISTPNAIYRDIEPPGTKAISCPSQGMGTTKGFYDRGSFGEIVIERGSTSGTGYCVLQLASTGQSLAAYSRCSWLEVTNISSSPNITPTISLKINNTYAGNRTGFVEVYDQKVLIGRITIIQTAE